MNLFFIGELRMSGCQLIVSLDFHFLIDRSVNSMNLKLAFESTEVTLLNPKESFRNILNFNYEKISLNRMNDSILLVFQFSISEFNGSKYWLWNRSKKGHFVARIFNWSLCEIIRIAGLQWSHLFAI